MVMDAIGGALGLIKPKKAKLVLDDTDPNLDPNPDPKEQEVEFMFNPTDYKITQTVQILPNATSAKPGGKPEYGGAGLMTVSMSLFLDDYASAEGDVTPRVTRLLDWTKPTKKSLEGKIPHPCSPLVKFQWGGNPQLENFKGLLSNVDVSYTVFRKDGTPVQATVGITIQGWQEPPKPPKQNPTSHAANSRRIHLTTEGDTLHSVAFGELGNATYWRAVAELNGIDDPLRLAPGTSLLIPSVADAARGS